MDIASVPATGGAVTDDPACTPAGVPATKEAVWAPIVTAAANASVHSVALATVPTAAGGMPRGTHAGKPAKVMLGPVLPLRPTRPRANCVALTTGHPTAAVADPRPRHSRPGLESAPRGREVREPARINVAGQDLERNSAVRVALLTDGQVGAAPRVPSNGTRPPTVPRSQPIGADAVTAAAVKRSLSRPTAAPPWAATERPPGLETWSVEEWAPLAPVRDTASADDPAGGDCRSIGTKYHRAAVRSLRTSRGAACRTAHPTGMVDHPFFPAHDTCGSSRAGGGSCSTRARPDPRVLTRSRNEAQKAPVIAPLQGGDDSSIERLVNGRDVRGKK